MMMQERAIRLEDTRVLVLTRTFEAPRARVFEARTTPELIARWWGPKGFTAVSLAFDVRPGGSYRACIRSPKGEDYRMRGTYREVVAPERLVFTFAWEDEHGAAGHETLVTVTFAEHAGRTTLVFRQGVFPSAEACDQHEEGWSECLARLREHLAHA